MAYNFVNFVGRYEMLCLNSIIFKSTRGKSIFLFFIKLSVKLSPTFNFPFSHYPHYDVKTAPRFWQQISELFALILCKTFFQRIPNLQQNEIYF